MKQSAGEGLSWQEESRELLQACRIFDLYRTRSRAAGGREGSFYVLQSPDWVNIVPIFDGAPGKESFLMIRQYRHGAGSVTVEFPAGLVDPGETPEQAAARELLEETGFQAGRIERIGAISPNPAFMNNLCHTFCARDLVRVQEPQPDRHEIFELLTVSREEVTAKMGREGYINAMTLTALYWYLRARDRDER
jgi:ADP-ribose pyrophosphatase